MTRFSPVSTGRTGQWPHPTDANRFVNHSLNDWESDLLCCPSIVWCGRGADCRPVLQVFFGQPVEDAMNHTVVWRSSAERTLARIWTNADDRPAVTDAANSIDVLLRTGPGDVGESRAGNTRILTVMPVSIYYDLAAEDRLAHVWAVWRVRRR